MAISKAFCQGGADFVVFSVGETGGRDLYSRRHEYPPDRPVVEWSKTAPHRTLPSGFLGSNPSWTDLFDEFRQKFNSRPRYRQIRRSVKESPFFLCRRKAHPDGKAPELHGRNSGSIPLRMV